MKSLGPFSIHVLIPLCPHFLYDIGQFYTGLLCCVISLFLCLWADFPHCLPCVSRFCLGAISLRRSHIFWHGFSFTRRINSQRTKTLCKVGQRSVHLHIHSEPDKGGGSQRREETCTLYKQ